MHHCHCVFPSEFEEEMITVPGGEAGTAVRVYLQAGPGGYVRVQQLAHDETVGWYVQKSMVLERDVVEVLVPQLRKALCLMPKGGGQQQLANAGEAIKFPRVAGSGETEEELVVRAG